MANDGGGATQESGVETRLAKPGGVTYMQIPATDPRRSGAFYAAVFGWNVHGSEAHLSFDAANDVAGAFVTNLQVAREPGVLPFIYVASVDETLGKVTANGGAIERPRYDEGGLWVAAIRDPAGNVIGVWQDSAR